MEYIIDYSKQSCGVAHIADKETEVRSLLEVREWGGPSHWGGLSCVSIGSLQELKLLISTLATFISVFCSLSPWLWTSPNFSTTMFPFAFLISLNSSRLEGPGFLELQKVPQKEWVFFPSFPSYPHSTLLVFLFPLFLLSSSSSSFLSYKE